MKTLRINCPLCAWSYDWPATPVSDSSLPQLLSTWREQDAETEKVLREHLDTHATHEWLKKVSSLQWELAQIRATFP